ncbi:MAG: UvrD-helicase domain-containing protein [Succinivibrionaceae bacterium]|nr:UvrD-helicase domain-containing protein [Succinivibrionaceae bacterium]
MAQTGNGCIKSCNEIDLARHAVVEASAGTGKTYTITGLVVRFVIGLTKPLKDDDKYQYNEILHPLPIEQILLSTFTRAATEEMRRKVRETLQLSAENLANMRTVLDCWDKSETVASCDAFLKKFAEKCQAFGNEAYVTDLGIAVMAGSLNSRLNQSALSGGKNVSVEAICKFAAPELAKAQERLVTAVRDIDRASIVTMHQFCQSVLRKNAFESGVLFKNKLIDDVSDNLDRAEVDSKRGFLYGDKRHKRYLSDYFLFMTMSGNGYSKSDFEKVAGLDSDEQIVNPRTGEKDYISRTQFEEMLEILQNAYEKSKKIFHFDRVWLTPDTADVVLDLYRYFCCISSDPKKVAVTAIEYKTLVGQLKSDGIYDKLEKKNLQSYLDDNHDGFMNEFCSDTDYFAKGFADYEEAVAAFRDFYGFWRFKYAKRVNTATKRVLRDRQEMIFDDLINDLANALDSGNTASNVQNSSAARLVDSIRREFPVAILDEFQDTSNSQYRIFNKIYLEGSGERLFIVGDPKQAIYSFRKADVFTYLDAREKIEQSGGARYTLATNFRSDIDVINSVNALFSNPSAGRHDEIKSDGKTESSVFDYRQYLDDYFEPDEIETSVSKNLSFDKVIDFTPSAYPEKKKKDFILLHDFRETENHERKCKILPGLVTNDCPENLNPSLLINQIVSQVEYLLCYCRKACLVDGNHKSDQNEEYLILTETEDKGVFEIGTWNGDGAKYVLKPVAPADIAVLVLSGSKGTMLKNELDAHGIQAVMLSDKNSIINRRPEFLLMSYFLRTMTYPSERDSLFKLVTCPLMNKSFEEMHSILNSSSRYSDLVDLLARCHDIWTERGFMAAFYRFIFSPQIMLPARLKSREDGVRMLINLMHLAEMVQKKASGMPSKYAVYSWFTHLRFDGDDSEASAQTDDNDDKFRLEQQKNVVRIVTVHSSKGLEYPIVLNPYLFSQKYAGGKSQVYSHRDLEKGHRITTVGEQKPHETVGETDDETLRLLYVALTRARHLNWLNFNGSAASGENKVPMEVLLMRRYRELNGLINEHKDVKTWSKSKKKDEALRKLANQGLPNDVYRGPLWEKFQKEEQELCQQNGKLFAFETATVNAGEAVSGKAGGDKSSLPLVRFDDADRQSGSVAAPAAAEFSGHIDRTWKITSYSSMCHHSGVAAAKTSVHVLLKDDEPEATDEDGSENQAYKLDRFHFPHGSASGTFLHHLLEVIDFPPVSTSSRKDKSYDDYLTEQIAQEVNKSYFADSVTLQKWKSSDGIEYLKKWFYQITTTPLCFGDQGVFALNQAEGRLPELNFTFSLGDKFKLSKLNWHLFQEKEKGRWLDIPEMNQTQQITGFLTGVIDLFFRYQGKYYVADYKSNFLGNVEAAYSRDNMERSIIDNRYDLQFMIYSLAAYRFLKSRVKDFDFERDFGGVMYLYIRGLEEKPNSSGSATGGYYRDLAKLGNGFMQDIDKIFG